MQSTLTSLIIEDDGYDKAKGKTAWMLALVVNGISWRVARLYASDANEAAQEFAGLLAEALADVTAKRSAAAIRSEKAEPYNTAKVPGRKNFP
jgi:hypothetical protein